MVSFLNEFILKCFMQEEIQGSQQLCQFKFVRESPFRITVPRRGVTPTRANYQCSALNNQTKEQLPT